MKYCTGCGADEESHKDIGSFMMCSSNLYFCEECGKRLEEDDIKTFQQKHDEGQAETLINGYKCSSCGFEIDY